MLGKLLDGRYQVTQVLSAGGFGETYIAQDTRRPGHPQCVVKYLKLQSSEPNYLEIARRLFKSEAETLEKLGEHSQIPRLLAYFEENEDFFLVQQYIAGRPLSAELQPGQKWTENQVVKLLENILPTLQFVHYYQVIHRDIKPDNIIRRQEDGQLVLIDFGAVKAIQTQIVSEQSQVSGTVAVGTIGYMPAEQSQGKPRPNSDIYALGMIAIQALTGLHPSELQENPQTGEILWQQHAQVSPKFTKILSKMVSYDYRKDRYQSVGDVIQDLQAYRTSATSQNSVKPKPKTRVQPPQTPVNSHNPKKANPQDKDLKQVLAKVGLIPFAFAGLLALFGGDTGLRTLGKLLFMTPPYWRRTILSTPRVVLFNNWVSIAGIAVFVLGLSLCLLPLIKPKLSQIYDIIIAELLLYCSVFFILYAPDFRNGTLAFTQVVLTIFVIFAISQSMYQRWQKSKELENSKRL
ncbi:protein kinase [Desertifilum sp. FACHB-1129]|uniref:non-specific serine/threonine protein kinase n=1 Tax=Desertifilum tharense IPPAS B-1220 TaxID=1781255 RepID=A0A1E5QK24_9CYAN|nr:MULTISPECIES: protein kinase [Desertifilum]MDA0211827.1 protein kinase [Cyanobacteria bacterium FC1]MBD2312056.1 protein kinase [Desertifilum sp. FACHB-1129]MBD2322509.1 protein kinase [Desertifilum sp. FACHB-866]MBD2332672.1 protein kinase [Desertifilum sp. FACHB-868]OEJ75046.1 hypothetical protein BH720_11290 [Desertifilum tharense IPPAS B-1220]